MNGIGSSVVVIGAGIGGLSAAIRLAAAGHRVTLLEQNAQVGGKMGEIHAAGFRWDTGPSVITMRHVLAELFATAGRRLDEELTLLPVEPLTRYFYPDGAILDATLDLAAMTSRIAALAEEDVEGYLAFLSYAARLHRVTGPVFIYGHPPTPASLWRVPLRDALSVDAWRTMDARIRRHVRSPHLRQLLGRFATYAGSDPFRASATLSVIAHVELSGGVWYPQGGVYAIAQTLARLAVEMGVEIRTGCTVRQIEVSGGRAVGVALDHARLAADVVVADVDIATVYSKLLPPDIVPAQRLARLGGYEPSCSGFILLLGVARQQPTLAHHNIFFSANYRAEFDAIFRQRVPPAEPTIYLAITSKSDPDHAPPGAENWFILVNAPPVGSGFDWQQQAPAYRDRVLDRLAMFGYEVRDCILHEQMFTPHDLAQATGAARGALYGMSLNSPLAPFRRPPNRCPDVRSLYFVGGTTHPGGGVPMVMLSARVAAQMIAHDLNDSVRS